MPCGSPPPWSPSSASSPPPVAPRRPNAGGDTRRAEKAECRRRHPSGSVASYLVGEENAVARDLYVEAMPPHFATWLRAEIAAEVARREAQVLADDDAVFAVVEAWRRGL